MLFDIGLIGTDQSSPDSDSDIKVHQFLESHELKLDSVKTLCKRLPNEGEIFFMWSVTSFNAFTFIPFVIKECGVIDNLVISTYSITSNVLNSLLSYIDNGMIKSVELLISDSINFRSPKIADMLKSTAAVREEVKIYFGWNHSKISLMQTPKGFYIVEGSGNWSENAKLEQYIMLNNKEVYEFRKDCIRNGFDYNAV